MNFSVHKNQKWIISPSADIIFFIGTPLFCLVPLMALRQVLDAQTILFFIMSFFAMGHHLPGFMRAYGDPDLFGTFKEKFLAAPLIVIGVVAISQFYTLHGLFLMVLLWEIWHLFMQHYGIMRIYDGKNKIFSKWNAKWDWFLTICAFITVVVYSPEYFYRILDHNQNVGLPFLSVTTVHSIKTILLVVTGAVFLCYVVNIFYRLLTRQKLSFPKIVVMFTTLFLIYFGWIHIGDLTIGYAAFAAFHDIQYFAIVWVYNNNLVKKQIKTSRLLRVFFTSRSVPVLVGYVLISFLYGTINYSIELFDRATWIKSIEILVISSTLLHYYFDGFIWKMRDKRNQENLEIETDIGWDRIGKRIHVTSVFENFGSYFKETGRLLIYFAVPIILLSFFQFYKRSDELAARESFVQIFSEFPGVHNDQGVLYSRLGDWARASEAYSRALQLDPKSHEALKNMGVVRARQGELELAHSYYKKALEVKPNFVEALNAQGLIYLQKEEFEIAQDKFLKAVAEFEYAPAYNNLGTAFLREDQYDEAIAAYLSAVEIDGSKASHHYNLGLAYQRSGQNKPAIHSFKNALNIAPTHIRAYLSLALSYQRLNQVPNARKALEEALRYDPDHHIALKFLNSL